MLCGARTDSLRHLMLSQLMSFIFPVGVTPLYLISPRYQTPLLLTLQTGSIEGILL